jgi:hypothetical protein
MPAKFTILALAFALLAGTVAAQPDPKPDPKKADDKKLVTTVYNIKPLIGAQGKAAKLTNADAIVELIFQSIPAMRELKAGVDGPQIIELDGGKLEVRATEKIHEEIADLLRAVEGLQDLAIDVKAEVIEFDGPTYGKLVKALPKGKTRPPVLLATGAEYELEDQQRDKALKETIEILQTGRVVQTSSGRFLNGVQATISARRKLVTYSNVPSTVRVGNDAEKPLLVKEGFGLVALPVVSVDRRFVRFKLTEQSTVITGLKKQDFGVIAGEKFVLQSLETEDLGAIGSAEVADGGTLLFRLAYAPKDKVWVVVVKPTLYIKAEQEELKKQEKKTESVFHTRPNSLGG